MIKSNLQLTKLEFYEQIDKYYTDEYRAGDKPLISETSWPFYERRAWTLINRWRVAIDPAEAPDYLKDCICNVAEMLNTQAAATDGTAVRGFSNDGYSETFESAKRDDPAFARAVKSAVNDYLAGTPVHNAIVFSGVRGRR